MGFTLDIDHWDWVNPETQKVLRLRRGDEVPSEVLDQEGIDTDELTQGFRPMFLKGQSEEVREQAGPKTESAATSQEAQSSSPKRAESK